MRFFKFFTIRNALIVVMVMGGAFALAAHHETSQAPMDESKSKMTEHSKASLKEKNVQFAIFAGGCFWCMEPPYDKLDGVLETVSGYSGGHSKDPTYKKISAGGTGHYEVVKVVYDANVVDYSQLLDVFWRNIDPFDDKGQFCDKGHHYKSVIFYNNQNEYQLAQQSLEDVALRLTKKHKEQKAIATEVLKASAFYPAEKYHQDYYKKNPIRYKYYRTGCGRDRRLKEVWSGV